MDSVVLPFIKFQMYCAAFIKKKFQIQMDSVVLFIQIPNVFLSNVTPDLLLVLV